VKGKKKSAIGINTCKPCHCLTEQAHGEKSRHRDEPVWMQCSPDVVRYREDLSCQCAAWCFGLGAALLQVPSAALASLFQCLALHTPSFPVSYSPKIVSIPPTSSGDLSSFVNRSTTGIEKKVSSLGRTEEKFSRKELWEYHKHLCPHC